MLAIVKLIGRLYQAISSLAKPALDLISGWNLNEASIERKRDLDLTTYCIFRHCGVQVLKGPISVARDHQLRVVRGRNSTSRMRQKWWPVYAYSA